jgi:hypothetical protein
MATRVKTSAATIVAVGLVLTGLLYLTNDARDAAPTVRATKTEYRTVRLEWHNLTLGADADLTWTFGRTAHHEPRYQDRDFVEVEKVPVGSYVGLHAKLHVDGEPKHGRGRCTIHVSNKLVDIQIGNMWECKVGHTVGVGD